MIAIVPYLNIGVKHHINYNAQRAQNNPFSDKHAGQPAESGDCINTMSGALEALDMGAPVITSLH